MFTCSEDISEQCSSTFSFIPKQIPKNFLAIFNIPQAFLRWFFTVAPIFIAHKAVIDWIEFRIHAGRKLQTEKGHRKYDIYPSTLIQFALNPPKNYHHPFVKPQLTIPVAFELILINLACTYKYCGIVLFIFLTCFALLSKSLEL